MSFNLKYSVNNDIVSWHVESYKTIKEAVERAEYLLRNENAEVVDIHRVEE